MARCEIHPRESRRAIIHGGEGKFPRRLSHKRGWQHFRRRPAAPDFCDLVMGEECREAGEEHDRYKKYKPLHVSPSKRRSTCIALARARSDKMAAAMRTARLKP